MADATPETSSAPFETVYVPVSNFTTNYDVPLRKNSLFLLQVSPNVRRTILVCGNDRSITPELKRLFVNLMPPNPLTPKNAEEFLTKSDEALFVVQAKEGLHIYSAQSSSYQSEVLAAMSELVRRGVNTVLESQGTRAAHIPVTVDDCVKGLPMTPCRFTPKERRLCLTGPAPKPQGWPYD